MSTSYPSLARVEAEARVRLLRVEHYDVSLDLTGEETFTSTTVITFASEAGSTFLDVSPTHLRSATLDGAPLDVDSWQGGRLPLSLSAGSHELVVEAVMAFRNDGEGLHLHVDPADGNRYVYAMSFMEAAPSIFACFDQPDLKAALTLHVRTPQEWIVKANAAGAQVEPGVWEFERSAPLSTYFVTLVAGPYHLLTDHHDGIELSLSSRQSLAPVLERDATEILDITKQSFDEFHRLFGIRYPFGHTYHQAFVPEFNAGAMENPGCVTYRDPMLFHARVPRGQRVQRASTIAHEMAHQWFGNLVTPQWWDDLWLNESFAEYMGTRVTAAVTQFDDAWTHASWARRQWGLTADQRPSTHPVAGNGADDARSALQNFDGISYAKGAAVLKQLASRLGDETFFAGVRAHFAAHSYGNATMHDLFDAFESAGSGSLSGFANDWLRTAGPDALAFDRTESVLLRVPHLEPSTTREHAIDVAIIDHGTVTRTPVTLGAEKVAFEAPATAAVVLDPDEQSWSASMVDHASMVALTRDAATISADHALSAGVWNAVRSTVHQAAITPQSALEFAIAAIPHLDDEDAVATVIPWAVRVSTSVPDASERRALRERLDEAAFERTETAPHGSTLQIAAMRGAIASCTDHVVLRAWDSGFLPEGVEADEDLMWRLWNRSATLGDSDVEFLDEMLAENPTERSRVEYVRARASRPEAEHKVWAWQFFTGEQRGSNYEIEAAGLGMWQFGQEDLLADHAAAYLEFLPRASQVHTGWVLGTALRSFFPSTFATEEFLAACEAALEGDLEPVVRRAVADSTDDLRRRLMLTQRGSRH